MTVQQIQAFVQERKLQKQVLQKQLDNQSSNKQALQNRYDDLVEARRIISEAARSTQLQFQGFVESLVTMAIQTVFPEQQYRFVMEFDLKANRSEINLLVQQGEKEPYRPEDEQGGGLLDVLSFALRVVMWSLEKPRSRPVFVMDEPFRYCGKLTSLAGNMMKEISQKLGIQIIMVTHEDSLSEIADKSWLVKREKGGWSNVQAVGIQEVKQEENKSKLKRRK
jgi:DNA repair exonuclease SbcCD ATPase subunit